MVKLLIASVIVMVGSIYIFQKMATPDSLSTPDAANSQIEQSREDINQAVQQEAERAKALNQNVGE